MPRAGTGRSMRRSLGRLLDASATVYTRASGGTYTVVAKTGLACLLQEQVRQNQASDQRAVQANEDTLYWEPSYTMPSEYVRIAVDSRPGEVWNLVAGTMAPDVGPGNVVVLRHATVVRAT